MNALVESGAGSLMDPVRIGAQISGPTDPSIPGTGMGSLIRPVDQDLVNWYFGPERSAIQGYPRIKMVGGWTLMSQSSVIQENIGNSRSWTFYQGGIKILSSERFVCGVGSTRQPVPADEDSRSGGSFRYATIRADLARR
ncbi:hypothetical protein NPIL_392881 [Nephila pilipes]|uniref:Uncharacterized protein n=1 Tax=Nephila pilipes TaxID=299642 RepID=A0A8X6TM49_NEPPI|nr:hypothetical protein NPIL_392881 [Nephila pilipes]